MNQGGERHTRVFREIGWIDAEEWLLEVFTPMFVAEPKDIDTTFRTKI